MDQQTDQHVSAYIPGIIIVIISVVFLSLFMLNSLSSLIPRRHHGDKQNQCANNVRQLIVAIQLYQQDHNGKFPDQATMWRAVSFPPKCVICPDYSKKVIGYGYNINIAGKTLKSKGMPEAQNLVVMADSKTPLHQLAVPTDIDFRHTGKAFIGFADGHVAIQPLGGIPSMKPAAAKNGGR